MAEIPLSDAEKAELGVLASEVDGGNLWDMLKLPKPEREAVSKLALSPTEINAKKDRLEELRRRAEATGNLWEILNAVRLKSHDSIWKVAGEKAAKPAVGGTTTLRTPEELEEEHPFLREKPFPYENINNINIDHDER